MVVHLFLSANKDDGRKQQITPQATERTQVW
jgi:hypothetical protein